MRVRGFIDDRALVFELSESCVKYIHERLSEGAKAKCALLWLDEKKRKLCIGIVFEKDAPKPYTHESILAIDVNTWLHGITWGLIKSGRIVSEGRFRPDLGYLKRLYDEMLHLSNLWGMIKRLGLEDSEIGKKIRRQLKAVQSKIYRYLKDFCNKTVHRLIKKALKHRAKIIVDDVLHESIQELREEILDEGFRKIMTCYIRRFVKLLENQCLWHGIPFEKKRLSSTICPRCNSRLVEVEPRVMYCLSCGFREHRDKIPILHASKLSLEL